MFEHQLLTDNINVAVDAYWQETYNGVEAVITAKLPDRLFDK